MTPRPLGLTLLLTAACAGGTSAPDAGPSDARVTVPGPDGAPGVCCPRADDPSCECSELGGWAPSLDVCPRACGVADFIDDTDDVGCPRWRVPPSSSCVEVEIDLGPPRQPLGGPWRATTDCAMGVCQRELPPPGAGRGDLRARRSPVFPGGVCTLDGLDAATADCLDDPTLCGEEMICVEVTSLAFGGMCLPRCDPRAPGNDVCRAGWACAEIEEGGACVTGCLDAVGDCLSDAILDCTEENGIPGCQSALDCLREPDPCRGAGPDANVALIVVSSCDFDTFTCQPVDPPRDPGAGVGRRCGSDDVCGAREICGGARAAFWTSGATYCLRACELGAGSSPDDPATWVTGRGGCPDGFQCLAELDAARPERGVCVRDDRDPFNFAGAPRHPFGSGPRTPNLGASCTEPTECFNAFGYGDCLVGLNGRDGLCTVAEAGPLEAAGFDVCPDAEALVVSTRPAPTQETACLPTCDGPDACPAGFGCIPDGTGSGARICAATGCSRDAECRSGARCLAGACFALCDAADACADGLGCLPLDDLFAIDLTESVCFAACAADAQCPRDQLCAGETADSFGRCITACADATECAAGEACVDFDGASGGERECRASCTLDGECRPGERCTGARCA